MRRIDFECKLITDVVLNQSCGTSGYPQTLDFIPGSCFWGIVAQTYNEGLDASEQLELFHKGSVKFGDAHIGFDHRRSMKTPAAWFAPKLSGENKKIYVHHSIDNFGMLSKDQLKQERKGYYIFDGRNAKLCNLDKRFSLKSAHDFENRRSKDAMMYGYEALRGGISLYFSVWVDKGVSEKLVDRVVDSLTGTCKIGRSRTAEYGLVEIAKIEYTMPQSTTNWVVCKVEEAGEIHNRVCAVVYADSRLLFRDKYGIPTCQPTAKDFGFDGCEIVWSKSQIRTYQYSAWNGKRLTRDADRLGIEKGSVIVIAIPDTCIDQYRQCIPTEFVGEAQNEGFGRILVNPDFLLAKSNENGLSNLMFDKFVKDDKEEAVAELSDLNDKSLIEFLKSRRDEERNEMVIYQEVNDFVKSNANRFGGSFRSQWGTIRTIASGTKSGRGLILEIKDYLTHGVMAKEWEKRDRLPKFIEFIEVYKDDSTLRAVIINLASQMAKEGGRK